MQNNNLTHPRLQHWQSLGSIQKLNGHNIFVINQAHRDENKPTILLIHGFPTSTFDFIDIWSELSEHYSLICLDMLGFGFSDKPNRRDYTIHKQADLFDTLITELNLSQYHILAHDYGVSVAQELLSRQLDTMFNDTERAKIVSCCFLNGGLFPETHQALLIQKLMLSPIGPVLNKVTGIKLFSASFSKVFGSNTKPSKSQLNEFWEVINYNQGRHLFHNLITYINDRIEHRGRWLNSLQHSSVPLALINGSLDPVSGRHLVTRYKQLACRLDYLVELNDVGHYPHVEAPKTVKSAYLEFLNKTNIRA